MKNSIIQQLKDGKEVIIKLKEYQEVSKYCLSNGIKFRIISKTKNEIKLGS